ncbi:MAG: hypothetical protein LH468_13570, partial [Nocardioides sp.]|nr:hypothetical protein [Nocardioides sp.]
VAVRFGHVHQQLVVQAQHAPCAEVCGADPNGDRPDLEELGGGALDEGVAGKASSCGGPGLSAPPPRPFFLVGPAPAARPRGGGAGADYSLACLEIAGDSQRVSEWLGETVEAPLEDVKVEWVAPHGTPGILAALVQTPHGLVRI